MKFFIKKHDNQSDYQNLLENYNFVLDKWKILSKEIGRNGYDSIRRFGFLCDLASRPLEIALKFLSRSIDGKNNER